MGKDKNVVKNNDSLEVAILDTHEGYLISYSGRMYLRKGKENFEEFTARVDNTSNEFRNNCIRKVANHLGVDVRFEE